ncbi:copper-binding transcription factor [Pyricularia grisea]|nr:copper-binding transcription factor [Pyricularia grisea]
MGDDMWTTNTEPIAIIGSGCRFPGGSTTPSKLWELLKDPKDIVSEIKPDRFDVDKYFHPDHKHHGTSNVRHSYFLDENFKLFDAKFFGIRPQEAMAMDPQQRFLLETVYESLEAAGITIGGLKGSQTGVFVGNMGVDYSELLSQDIDAFPTYFAPGTARSILSNRISYFFDLHGPSVTVDTACSSSLVAVHQAVQSLRLGETPVAIVCGANLLLGPAQYIAESKLQMLSPNGRSRMWDASADGYARGEGFASIVLKPLSAALANGDHIECIIRETGCNQDGRTKGITMPSPLAQCKLIQETYRRAGLDLSKSSDRPQYFEAHGTGTPAGDPVEAEAISTAFFGPQSGYCRKSDDPKLYVGSVKTVIGHTEGTAGLAGLIKASLAMKAKSIPPNLHLERVNPAVQPFYGNLEIPTRLMDWPEPEPGQPLRASVNSFGFGGANAHVILESYTPPAVAALPPMPTSGPVFSPFVFSASSDKALAGILSAYGEYLSQHPTVDLRSVAYTLSQHRSIFDKRAVISAADLDTLKSKLKARSEEASPSAKAVQSLERRPRYLGIFTGQGAQWARMGVDIITASPAARAIFEELEQSLQTLPEKERPSWSMLKELLAPPETSRVYQAHISQTVCTAVQILLVQLLRAAGVEFSCVVGHSSGEIAAAYTAGYLSAKDAVRAAYFRGVHTHLAKGANGQPGGMIAVGTTLEDAKELCEVDDFKGRLCVAASNSNDSVTLSGDLDAVKEVKKVLDAEGKFNKQLQVDKGYHSHHMLPCSEPYITSLQNCDIQARVPGDAKACRWISSVYVDDMASLDCRVQDKYWVENLAKPVLFSQALSYALGADDKFDCVIEVGPHPALKGPASQIIQSCLGEKLPYFGCLNRGTNSNEAMAECLGGIWSSFGSSAVNLAAYEKFASGNCDQRLLKELPSYKWDHDVEYYFQSRLSKVVLHRGSSPNELLGTRLPDDSAAEVRWRNSLNPAEVPWLLQHSAQGQTVFPGTGYIATVLEAVKQLFESNGVQTVELRDFVIGNALVIEANAGVETLFSLTGINSQADRITAHFSFSSQQGNSTKLVENASGDLTVVLGKPSQDALPKNFPSVTQMKDIDEARFYEAIDKLGYGYEGPFRALSRLQRRMGAATGFVAVPEKTKHFDQMVFHPAALDAMVQTILLAYCYPGDTRLQGISLPTGIDCIRFNYGMLSQAARPGSQLPFMSFTAFEGDDVLAGAGSDVGGDVDVFSEDKSFALVQLQGLHTKPLSPPSAATDLQIFSEMEWKIISPEGADIEVRGEKRAYVADLFTSIERVAYFYMRHVDREIGKDRSRLAAHHVRFLEWVDHMCGRVEQGTLPHINRKWDYDTRDDILKIIAKYPDSIDLELMHAVGENLCSVFRGEMNPLEPMVKNNMLNRFYTDALGMSPYTEDLARMVEHITHRYPHMNILEVGAGTGGATKVMLRKLKDAFASYTYTDISSGFFADAREVFKAHESKMVFKTLDIEKEIADQGYEENSFDLVIANLVVHATADLDETMARLRRLVKPGGYLVLLEITNNDPLRFGFIFGPLPGWWLGGEDGRVHSPCVEVEWWDRVMKRSGFSGAEIVTPHHSLGPLSVIMTQAVDDRVRLLKEPTTADYKEFTIDPERLTIVGGASQLAKGLEQLLKSHYQTVTWIPNLEDVSSQSLPVMGSVLSLVELDEPLFKDMTVQTLEGFKLVFQQSRSVYWITCGASGANPYSNMAAGVARTVGLEMRHLRLGFLDFENSQDATVHNLSESFLQFEILGTLEQQGKLDRLTWYQEPELRFDGSNFLVPRIRLSKDRNARYNSRRRQLTKNVNPREVSVSLVPSGKGFVLEESLHTSLSSTKHGQDMVTLRVHYAMHRSVRLESSDYLFLVLGTDISSGEAMFALADSQKSIVQVDRQWTAPYVGNLADGKHALAGLYTQIIASTVVAVLSSGDSLVVLDAETSLSLALSARCDSKGVRLTLLSTTSPDSDSSAANKTVRIHPFESRRSIESKLPTSTTCFLNLSSSKGNVTADVINSYIPTQCRVETRDSLTALVGQITRSTSMGLTSAVADILRTCWANVQAVRRDLTPFSGAVFTPTELTATVGKMSPKVGNDALSVITDWTAEEELGVLIQPADSMVRFKQDKTYWLVGLTGGLALSLCRWMVNRGARYVVMTSRNPVIDKEWLHTVESCGATVKIFSNDVTDRAAVNSAYRIISATLPPIAGVVQGAMVLRDTMFAETTMETIETVLGPKVRGSIYLDEIFYSTPLDFFVFLSSVTSTSGNPGQSIYAGANMFMNSLAAQRRKRGVAGSSVEIGCIMGNGSVTSILSYEHQKYLFSVGNTWLSEQDFLTMFGEAVLASPPDSSDSVTSVTGLRLQFNDDKPDITWFSNPIFQHLVLQSGNAMQTSLSVARQGTPVKTLLQDAKSSEEVLEILEDAFQAKLVSSLQADPDSNILEVDLETLGMDSLVAVDLRSWFLAELSVDVPVLKILNGSTARSLLEFVQGLIPASMTPKLDGLDGADTAPQQAPPVTKTQPEVSIKLPGSVSNYPPVASVKQSDSASSSSPSPEARSPDQPRSVASSMTDDRLDLSTPTTSASFASLDDSRKLIRTVPVSFGQARFWFLRSYNPDPLAFNITSLMRITGPLRTPDFAKAVERVLNHHEALRTSFVEEENGPMQKIWSSPAFVLEQRKIIDDESAVVKACKDVQNTVYNLDQGQTMRILLLTKSPTQHVLVLGYHHINMDGVSFEVLFSDIEKAYNGLPLDRSVMQFPDFTIKEFNEFKSGGWESELQYWRSKFTSLPEATPLLSVSKRRSRPINLSYTTHSINRRISAEQSKAIQSVSRKFKATPFHFYLAVFKTLIARFSGTDDFCIGIADANRKEEKVMAAVGLYLNLLPLRMRSSLAQTFGEALVDMKRVSQEAFANSKVPFDVLLNELNVPRSSSHTPLFQTFVNYRRGISEERSFCGCTGAGELISGGQVGYDISLDVVENPDGDALVTLSVQKDLYDMDMANLLFDSYFRLVDSFSKNPATSLNRPALYDPVAVKKALELGCGPSQDLSWPETLVHRIEDMSVKYATKFALRNGQNAGLTYAQMIARVNDIAAKLIKAMVGSNPGIVGVMQASTMDFICSILAIWKAGAIYTPLDPRLNSVDRLRAVVDECQPICILVDATTKPLFDSLSSKAIQIDVSEVQSSKTLEQSPKLAIQAKGASAAAVFYTSGSTGTPKGISLSHTSLTYNIMAATQQFGFKEGIDIMLQQSSFSFDMSLAQMLTSLSNGGTLVVVPSHLRGDALGLSQLIVAENVSIVQASPTEYKSLIGVNAQQLRTSKWRVALSGGENMTQNLLEVFRSLGKPDLVLYNGYGPTEATINANTRIIPYHEPNSNPDLPLLTWENYSISIVDLELNPVPVGVFGEICIGGAGVGLGYFKNEELTSKAFVADKTAPPEFLAKGWKTKYRTGDLGRLSPDGGLIIEGRIDGDTQIKLRGIRIDLQNIESAILEAGAGKIIDVAVSLRRGGADESDPQYLVGHVVLDSDQIPQNSQQEFLAQIVPRLRLPQHMKPSLLVPIHSLPQTASHKLDRRALQDLPISDENQIVHQGAELGSDQAEMWKLWKQVIPSDVSSKYSITPRSDFFHVGGTSLLLVNLQSLIRKKHGSAPPLHAMFESSTVASMTDLVLSDNPSGNGALIDWAQETSIPMLAPNVIPGGGANKVSLPPRVVLITGATGFLGRQLVEFLLRQPDITRIHCLAVRNSPPSSELPFSDPRVSIHHGDLSAPRLGLGEDVAESLFAEADVIIHNGADVSFLKTYASLRPVNVGSTQELARLAAPRRIPFHFVSSASITQLTGKDEFGEASLAAWAPPADPRAMMGGYVAAKWASEVLLEKAARAWGLPVVIHRPSSITGQNANSLDLMGNMFKYIELLEAVPESDSWKGNFDFVSVENVAADVVQAVVAANAAASGGVKYIYEAGDIIYPLSMVKDMSEGGAELPVKTIPLAQWVKQAAEMGLDAMLAEYLLKAAKTGTVLAFPKLLKNGQRLV